VKLLFDQNLSFKLVASLADLFPCSDHVANAGLSQSTDAEIWNFAASRDFMIVSKDDDFRQMSMLRGAPPKVVWVQVGNCATSQIEQLLRRRYSAIESFSRSAESTFLIVRMDAV
jgi:predicted nuclease of predicted toxin-antitoxin system